MQGAKPSKIFVGVVVDVVVVVVVLVVVFLLYNCRFHIFGSAQRDAERYEQSGSAGAVHASPGFLAAAAGGGYQGSLLADWERLNWESVGGGEGSGVLLQHLKTSNVCAKRESLSGSRLMLAPALVESYQALQWNGLMPSVCDLAFDID